MDGKNLPSRTDPETLIEVCKTVFVSGLSLDELAEQTGIGDRTVRETVGYGITLGLLEHRGEIITTSLSESAVSSDNNVTEFVFRRAIEGYRPYREAIVTLGEEERITTVLDEPSIRKDAVAVALGHVVTEAVSDRQALLCMKTLDATGLGTFTHGRKGYPTRVELSDEFRSFATWLSEEQRTPDPRTDAERTDRLRNPDGEEKPPKEVTVSLTVDLNVESEQEAINLIRTVSSVLD